MRPSVVYIPGCTDRPIDVAVTLRPVDSIGEAIVLAQPESTRSGPDGSADSGAHEGLALRHGGQGALNGSTSTASYRLA
jgi:hypothetical protein